MFTHPYTHEALVAHGLHVLQHVTLVKDGVVVLELAEECPILCTPCSNGVPIKPGDL